MKQITNIHLTTLDKKLIKASIENGLKDVQTKKKRLHIICTNNEGEVKANLYSFEVGMGIGSKSRWVCREVVFSPF